MKQFFQRIQYKGNTNLSFSDLPRLMTQLSKQIPFENTDIMEGRSLFIDAHFLYDKIVKKDVEDSATN